MRRSYSRIFVLCVALCNAGPGFAQEGILPGTVQEAILPGTAQLSSNDHIFPAAPQAKPFIDFDSKGFLVNGKRTFLVSAGMEYARVPHQLWKDRLLRLRRAGFNCVEIYTFWNFHEPQQGVFDFSGDHDLGAFLGEVKKMGMYAIVRVGPYYCAEWDNGGYPLWLRFLPGVRVREPNAAFEKYTGLFFDRLIPIVAANQVNHGGAVILVQLENEHPDGWGTAMPNSYFRYLRDKALSLGLEVPYFFSGLHHASDPAGDGRAAADARGGGDPAGVAGGDPASLDDSSRPNPWFSTEFWSVWYSGYGSTDKDAREYERRTWKIIAHGGNGYNYYMAHGGSNFGYTNNDEDAASYDYGAAVGQAGDLRPIYYSFKRMGWFARSFESILENSVDATARWRGLVVDTAIRITARHSPAGDLVFFDNPSAVPVRTQLATGQGVKQGTGGGARIPVGGPLVLAPGEVFPVVHDFVMDSAVTLEWAPVRVLGISGQGNTTTMVIYGEAGSPAKLHFSVRGKATILEGGAAFSVNEILSADEDFSAGAADPVQGGRQRVVLQAKFSESRTPAEYSFQAGGKKWRILVMNRQLADRTWFLDAAGKHTIICGPAYAGGVQVQNGEGAGHPERVSLVTEFPWQGVAEYPLWLYGDLSAPILLRTHKAGLDRKTKLPLAPWEFRTGAGPAGRGYDDHDWKYSRQPLQMGADGDLTAEAWYRTVLHSDTAGIYTLQVEGGDRAAAFVDGKPAGSGDIRDGEITFNLSKGQHSVAIFTAHNGRDKLAAYLGSMDSVDRKGLFGKAVLRKGGPSIVVLGGWHFLKASAGMDSNQRHEGLQGEFPAAGVTGWQDYKIGQDPFAGREGFGWFRTSLADPGAGVSQIVLNFKSVDENATVFINGRRIARHEGWNKPFEVVLDGLDSLQRPLELTLFIENYSNEGGIDKPVRANYAGPGTELTEWRMRGGPGDASGVAGWKVLPAWTGSKGVAGKTEGQVADAAGPCFYRSVFMAPAYGVSGSHPVWRVHTDGLGHGSVWVNGHNLGRYPEKTDAPGLYIPECWLKAGRNTLTIFDDDGKRPDRVSVQAEGAAGRDISVFSNY